MMNTQMECNKASRVRVAVEKTCPVLKLFANTSFIKERFVRLSWACTGRQ